MRKADNSSREVKIACSVYRIDIDDNEDKAKNNNKESQETEKEEKTGFNSLVQLNAKSLTIGHASLEIKDKDIKLSRLALPEDNKVLKNNGDTEVATLQVPDFEEFSVRESTSDLPISLKNLTTNHTSETLNLKSQVDQEDCEAMIAMRNNKRKSSITNMAISSSIAASLIGVSSQVPRNFINKEPERQFHSATQSRNSICTAMSDEMGPDEVPASGLLSSRRKSRLPLLRLHMPQPHSWSNFISGTGEAEELRSHNSNHHYHFPHIPVPTITFTGDGPGRKFSIGIRRHSQTVSPGY